MPVPKRTRARPHLRRTPHLGYFLLLALALHGSLAWFAAALRPFFWVKPDTRAVMATWAPAAQDARAHEAILEAREARRRARKMPAPPQKQQPLHGTVVDLPKPAQDATPPDDAQFLAEHDARTAKQTRSRHAQMQEGVSARRPTAGQNGGGAKSSLAAPSGEDAAQKALLAAPVRPRLSQQEQVHLRLSDSQATLQNQRHQSLNHPEALRLRLEQRNLPQQMRAKEGAESPRAAVQKPTMPTTQQLIPSMGTLMRMGGGPKNDVGLHIAEADETFLNARAFKYASYFNRIKDQISFFWRPLAEYQRRDPTGEIYGIRHRTTVVTVRLDSEGTLLEAQLSQTSGLDFLDDEGIKALRSAAPFLHPPHGLLSEQGEIVFNFAFSVDLTGSSRMPP